MAFSVKTTLLPDGRMTAVLINQRSEVVAEMKEPLETAEEILIAARAFEEEHPELFQGLNLLDTAEESMKKNPDLFDENGLSAISEE